MNDWQVMKHGCRHRLIAEVIGGNKRGDISMVECFLAPDAQGWKDSSESSIGEGYREDRFESKGGFYNAGHTLK